MNSAPTEGATMDIRQTSHYLLGYAHGYRGEFSARAFYRRGFGRREAYSLGLREGRAARFHDNRLAPSH